MPDEFIDMVIAALRPRHLARSRWRSTVRPTRTGSPPPASASGGSTARRWSLWGAADPYLPPSSPAPTPIAFRTRELVELDGAGHWPWIDRPETIDLVCCVPAPLSPYDERPFTILGRASARRPLQLACLPKGIADAGSQFGLFFLAYNGYQVVRGITDSGTFPAFANARHVIDLENSLGAFFEPGFQQTLIHHAPWLIDFANFMYLNSHFVITTGFLAWLYFFRNEHFYFVRNMFMVAMGIALVGYALFPTAPPRLFPGLGFTDTIATFTGVAQDSQTASLLVNKYAAVPSMHIAFSLMVAVPGRGALAATRGCGRCGRRYPLLILFVIVATGNHFWFDAVAGAAVACFAAVVARQLARAPPGVWSWPRATTRGARRDASNLVQLQSADRQRRPQPRTAAEWRGYAPQPADRVPPDPERDLAHRADPQPGRRRADARTTSASSAGSRSSSARSWTRSTAATRGCRARAPCSAPSSTRPSTGSRRAWC